MSKEDLARFKSADAKLLALQRRKALLDEKAVELDDDQALRPARIMVRAEQGFSGQSLGASSGQLSQLNRLAETAVQPAGIMERAERDFSRQSLGASSGQLAQLAANHVPFERYHASEPEQRAQWSLSVQPAPHVAHESHVSQPDGGPPRLDR